MKTFFLLALVVAAATAELTSPKLQRVKPTQRHGEIYELTFVSRLDHQNPRNDQTVNLTYLLKDDYFVEDGPIYVYVQDPDGLTDEFLETGLLHDLAVENGAALVTANQRFFRSNTMTRDASVENLQFLTVDQMINDIPYLIDAVRTHLLEQGSQKSRVILVGSGFGATMATWAKQKFPHLIFGVWSSSGIFLQAVHSDYPLEALSDNIRRVGGDECANNINEAYLQTSELMNRRQHGRLANAFNTCFYPYSYDSGDVALFFGGITIILNDYVDIFHSEGIQHLCSDLAAKNTSSDYPEFEAYGRWIRHVFTDEFCLDVSFTSRFLEATSENWDYISLLAWSKNGVNVAYPMFSRPSLWLRCTQIGGHQTTVNSNSLFAHTIAQDHFFEFCSAVFDESYNYMHLAGAVSNLNLRYGGRTPTVPFVLYTNGDLDQKMIGGVVEQPANTVENFVINIPNTGQSGDLSSINPYVDSPELIEAKEQIKQVISMWGNLNYH